MSDQRKQIMIGGPVEPFPGIDIIAAIDTMEFFAQDYVDAWCSMNPADVDHADYVVIPGGVPDIDPELYGETNTASHDIDKEMDRIQLEIIDRAVRQRKPLMGICRGLQLACAYFGGTIIQDIEEEVHKTDLENPHFHKIYNVPGSYFYSVYKDSVKINSAHHQAIRKLPPRFKVTGLWCQDDKTAEKYLKLAAEGKLMEGNDECIIETVEHMDYPFLGLQWHPEMEGAFLCKHIDRTRIRDYFYTMK